MRRVLIGLGRCATTSGSAASGASRVLLGAVGAARPGDLRRGRSRGDRGVEPSLRAAALPTPASPRVAIVHDWLTGMRGGEKVLEAICELYPDATDLHARAGPGSVSARSNAVDPDVARPAAARAPPALPPLPAAVPDGGRAVRPGRLRPGDQQQPLRREVGRPAPGGHPPLLLPLAHALRVGSVRRLFRPGSGRAGSEPAAPAGLAGLARWDAATAAAWTAFSRTLNMLRAGSADTIIAGRPLCIRPSIRPSIVPGAAAAPQPEPASSSCPRWCPTSASMWRSRPAAQLGCPLKIVGRGPEEARLRSAGRPGRRVPGLAHRRGNPGLYRRATAVLLPGGRISAWCRSRRRPAARRWSPWPAAARARRLIDG